MEVTSSFAVKALSDYLSSSDGPYQTMRSVRVTLQWSVFHKGMLQWSDKSVANLKKSVIGISIFSSVLLVPRLWNTLQKTYQGKSISDKLPFELNFVGIVGDSSKIALIALYNYGSVLFLSNAANFIIYSHRLYTLSNVYKLSFEQRERKQTDEELKLKIARTVAAIAYSILKCVGTIIGMAFLSEAVFLTLTSIKQIFHFMIHCHTLNHSKQASESDEAEPTPA